MPVLRLGPEALLRQLDMYGASDALVLVDIIPDSHDPAELDLSLNLIFNPRPFRTHFLHEEDWWFGSTGAELFLEAANGSASKYTLPTTISVSHSDVKRRSQHAEFKLEPRISSKSGSVESELELGSMTIPAGGEMTFQVQFQSSERVLEAVKMTHGVRWVIRMPRTENVMRDFLLGNLFLEAVCRWDQLPHRGKITVRPHDIRLFDPQQRPAKKAASLVVRYLCWKRDFHFRFTRGFTIDYEVTDA